MALRQVFAPSYVELVDNCQNTIQQLITFQRSIIRLINNRLWQSVLRPDAYTWAERINPDVRHVICRLLMRILWCHGNSLIVERVCYALIMIRFA